MDDYSKALQKLQAKYGGGGNKPAAPAPVPAAVDADPYANAADRLAKQYGIKVDLPKVETALPVPTAAAPLSPAQSLQKRVTFKESQIRDLAPMPGNADTAPIEVPDATVGQLPVIKPLPEVDTAPVLPKPMELPRAQAAPPLMEQISAEAKTIKPLDIKEMKAWRDARTDKPGERMKVAAQIRDGKVKAADLTPEQVPWDQLMGQQGYAQLAAIGMRDPQKAHKYLAELQKGMTGTATEQRNLYTPSFGTGFARGVGESAAMGALGTSGGRTTAEKAGHFAGSVVGQIPATILAAETAGAPLVAAAASKLPWLAKATPLAKIAYGAIKGLGTGLALGTAREGAGRATGQVDGGVMDSAKRIGGEGLEYAAYAGVYSGVTPAVEAATERITGALLARPQSAAFVRAVQKAAEKVPALQIGADVVQGTVGGAAAGATVGTGKALLSQMAQDGFDLQAVVQGIAQETGQEVSEELVEAIAMGVAFKLMGGKGPAPNAVTPGAKANTAEAPKVQTAPATTKANAAQAATKPAPQVPGDAGMADILLNAAQGDVTVALDLARSNPRFATAAQVLEQRLLETQANQVPSAVKPPAQPAPVPVVEPQAPEVQPVAQPEPVVQPIMNRAQVLRDANPGMDESAIQDMVRTTADLLDAEFRDFAQRVGKPEEPQTQPEAPEAVDQPPATTPLPQGETPVQQPQGQPQAQQEPVVPQQATPENETGFELAERLELNPGNAVSWEYVAGPRKGQRVAGTLLSVDADTMKVQTAEGQTVSLRMEKPEVRASIRKEGARPVEAPAQVAPEAEQPAPQTTTTEDDGRTEPVAQAPAEAPQAEPEVTGPTTQPGARLSDEEAKAELDRLNTLTNKSPEQWKDYGLLRHRLNGTKATVSEDGGTITFSGAISGSLSRPLGTAGFRYSKESNAWTAKALTDGARTLAEEIRREMGTSEAPAAAQTAPATMVKAKPAGVEEKPAQPAVDLEKAKREKIAQSLRAAADTLLRQADEIRGRDRQTNTARRANMAASALKDADAKETMAKVIQSVAGSMADGTLPESLSGIKTKGDVEWLHKEMRLSTYRASQRNAAKSYDDPTMPEHITYAKFPSAMLEPDDLRRLVEWTDGKRGMKDVRRKLSMMMGNPDADGRVYVGAILKDVEAAIDAAENKDTKYRTDTMRSRLADQKKAYALGLTTDKAYKQALGDLLTLTQGKTEKSPEQKRQDSIAAMEREMVGRKIDGYFPTPRATVDKLLEAAEIEPGMSVLEPSAGKGNIADVIKETAPEADLETVEYQSSLSRILEAKGHKVVGNDFLKHQGQYDRIVMNPPFEQYQDVEHVKHAYDLLKPGGRLVAVMSEGPFFRSDKKGQAFRDWLEEVGGTSEKLPEGSFKSSERPTGVATRMVVIDKPGEAAPVAEASTTPTDEATTPSNPSPVAQREKEPWQMTLEEVNQQGYLGYDITAKKEILVRRPGRSTDTEKTNFDAHRRVVATAVSEGKPVPAEVLEDYPDLQKVAESKQGNTKPPNPSPVVEEGKGKPVAETPKVDPKVEAARKAGIANVNSAEDLAERLTMFDDAISTKRANGEKAPQEWLDKRAALADIMRGEMPQEGIASNPVFGHPQATSVGGGKYSNLIPIRATSLEQVERFLERFEKVYSELAREVATAEYKAKQAKGQTKADKEARAYVQSTDFTDKQALVELMRDETRPELNRLLREAEKYGKKEDTAPPEERNGSTARTQETKTAMPPEGVKVKTSAYYRNEQQRNEAAGDYAKAVEAHRKASGNDSQGFEVVRVLFDDGKWRPAIRTLQRNAQPAANWKELPKEKVAYSGTFYAIDYGGTASSTATTKETTDKAGQGTGPAAEGKAALSVREQLRQKTNETLKEEHGTERAAGFNPFSAFQTAQQRKAGQQQAQSYSFADTETEKRFQQSKGVQPPSMWEKLAETWQTLKNQSTREWEHLPRGAEFAELRFKLNRLKQGKAIAGDQTIRNMQGLTVKFTPAQYDLFTRKVVLDDIMEDIESAEESQKTDKPRPIPKLAFGFTPESARKAHAEVTALVEQDAAVKESVEQRKALVKEIVGEYMKAAEEAVGYRPPLNRRDYFRHQVLAYQNATAPTKGTGQKVKAPTGRGFTKAREGSELDYNTEYRQAEFEWMAQMLYDTRVFQLLKFVKDHHDISAKLKADAKEKGGDWKQALPEGYVLWQPRDGNLMFKAHAIPEQAIRQAMAQKSARDVEYMDIFPEDLREVLVVGPRRAELAIPEGVAKTLDVLGKVNESGVIDHAIRKMVGTWKHWQLLSPARVIKYNLNNLSGDADAAVFNLGAFKRVPKAAEDLYEFLIRKKAPSAELDAWLSRGGLEVNQQVAEDITNLNGLEVFWNLTDRKARTLGQRAIGLPVDGWKGYWKAARMTSDFREALLRYANFLEYREQLKTNGRPANFGASLREEVMALTDPDDRAFKLSNDLMGAYDEVTVTGQWMRERLAPFWSFQEVNARRYYRLLKNAMEDGALMQKTGQLAARKLAGVVVKAPLTALTIGKFVVRANLLVAALSAWNYLMHRDEEEDLPKDVRSRPHVVLGRGDDGKVQYLTVSGSWYDFISWFGLNETPMATADFLSGKKSIKEIVIDMAKAPINKFAQTVGGPFKSVVEAGIGKSTFPDVFEPRPVRDKWEELFGSLGLREEYKAAKNKPLRGDAEDSRGERYFKGLLGRVFTSVDPEEVAYNEIRNQKYDWLKKQGKPDGGGMYTPRSNAAYYLKLALRYQDETAARYWLTEYARLGGTRDNLKESMEAMHPLAGLTKEEWVRFMADLSEKDKARYNTALQFYTDLMRTSSLTTMPEYRTLPKK